MKTADWTTANRILCIRLDSLGDVLMTTPALGAIKETNPQAHLTLMTSEAGSAIAPLLPIIDETLVYDAPWLKATAPRTNSQPEYAQFEALRQQFDAAIIFTVYSQNPLPSAFMTYMADIPLRLAHCRENPYQLLTHTVKEPEPEQFIRHEVQRQLDLVASVGFHTATPRMSLDIPLKAQKRVALLLSELGLSSSSPWVVVHAGASAPSRRYSPEQFAQVADALQTKGIPIVFTGTKTERPLIDQIRSQMGTSSLSLVGMLDLAGLAALLQTAPLLLSNNTGPVHLAAAVGTPVVDLYALTNLQHTPWGVPNRVLYHEVPCRLCYKSICPEGHHDCLRRVEPEQVVAAVVELLAETHRPSDSFPSMEMQLDSPSGNSPLGMASLGFR
ncbi:glycosyltransferase family 9 protein [Pseudanabaena sp. FACHB-2040]|uniref:glycosyltransferase family 9 protein n=1 Tax=Pseudanabaena sp. FACHB-2040 TaxID=2692859 RepID=UPI001682F047|nr:glycosyltransferase family 9 protein [Pseudanabaena sp. FACHB-2040]MBD2257223.1 glycosyltransferase family 9 protein [Pseudanabaena sp. FACHB-2040]